MLQRSIEIIRRRRTDHLKARRYATEVSAANYRAAMRDYDAFVPAMGGVSAPAFEVGTARDSTGSPVSVRLGLNDWASHWMVQGSTGSGKTTFATSLAATRLASGYPTGVVDCKAGFFDAAIDWLAAVAYRMPAGEQSRLAQRLAIVNPFADTLVPMNVCRPPHAVTPEVQAYDITLSLSRLFETGMSLHMENILRHLLLLLMSANLTLVEAPVVLEDEVLRGILTERCDNPILKEFFFRTYPSLPQPPKTALLVRLQALLLPENLRLMLGSDEMIDLKGIIERGDPLFVFLGKGLGVPEEQVDLIGSLVIQLLLQASYASAQPHRPYILVLDEFFHLLTAPNLTARFATALTTLRSFGVYLCLVMHNFAQVPPVLQHALLDSCSVALFRTSGRNAEYFGDFLPDQDPESVAGTLWQQSRPQSRQELRRRLTERLQRLENRHLYFYDRSQPYRAVHVRVPDIPAPHEFAGITRRQLNAFVDAQRLRIGGVALPKSVLRQQLAKRQERLRQLIRPPVELRAAKPPSRRDRATERSTTSRRPKLG